MNYIEDNNLYIALQTPALITLLIILIVFITEVFHKYNLSIYLFRKFISSITDSNYPMYKRIYKYKVKHESYQGRGQSKNIPRKYK